jgi:phage-related protein
MFSDILNFKVKLYSKDGKNSEVLEYLTELLKDNEVLGQKSITGLKNLPAKIYSNKDIKPIKTAKYNIKELRIQSGSNICRFFFVIENPNVIVVYGFTKKTQKTDKKDVNSGINNLEDYLLNKLTIEFDY